MWRKDGKNLPSDRRITHHENLYESTIYISDVQVRHKTTPTLTPPQSYYHMVIQECNVIAPSRYQITVSTSVLL